MIFGKMWRAFRAQLNKIANIFFEADPIAQMRYEYDQAVEQLKEGRQGLELYRGLVERVTRQVRQGEDHGSQLEAKARAYLKAGDRATAAKFALESRKAKQELAQNQEQLDLHERAYGNNLNKIKHANKSLAGIRQNIQRYDAELRMSEAEAEIAKLSESFDFNVTTDFGQLENLIQEKIDANRGRTRVAADLSERGIAEIQAEEQMEEALAEEALREMEVEMGLRTPATSEVVESAKELGPSTEEQTS